MKKILVFTCFSLLALGGFVAGFSGLDLAKAGTEYEIFEAVTAPDVEAIVVISKGHKIDLLPGPGITFREPKNNPNDATVLKNYQQETPPLTPAGRLPVALKHEVDPGPFKVTTMKVYGDKTCVWLNGTLYCW